MGLYNIFVMIFDVVYKKILFNKRLFIIDEMIKEIKIMLINEISG